MIAQFLASVTPQAELKWHHQRGLEDFLAAHAGKAFRVSFNEPRRRRTGDQNSWYHACIVGMIAEAVGEYGVEGHQRVHDALRARYLGTEEVEVLGQRIQRLRSTTDLSTKEFSEYCEAIRADAAMGEFGHAIDIPDPE